MVATFRWLESGVTWRQATKIRLLQSVGPDVWVEAQRIRRFTTSGGMSSWLDVYVKPGTTPTPTPSPTPTPTPTPPAGPLAVKATPSTIIGSRISNGPVLSNKVLAEVTGGTPPYTYKWSRATWPSGYLPFPLSPDAAETFFCLNLQLHNLQVAGKFRCDVVDSLGHAVSALVNVTFYTGTTNSTSIEWNNISKKATGGSVSTGASNQPQIMPVDGTLNISKVFTVGTSSGVSVRKNDVDMGLPATLAVLKGDAIYFRGTFTTIEKHGTITVTGAVTGSGGLAGVIDDEFKVDFTYTP